MKTPIGVSSFGLQDCIKLAEQHCYQNDFYPASVVLPTNPFGRIITGEEAYRERTHVGLSWPPESRVPVGEPLRRSPVFAVWLALVMAGDHLVRWNAGRGVTFPLARILAAHIQSLILENPDGKRLNVPGSGAPSFPVVAIPDHLDEFGQELLIRELRAFGFANTILVWRPVAAALSWLDKVEGDFPTRMSPSDHIHCIYLGPDALEFTTFRLRVKEHENQYYVLPLRDRPKSLPPFNGMDWAGRLIEEKFDGIDEGAFWQAFIEFPEIWQALAGRELTATEIPKPWNRNNEWASWNPATDLCGSIYDVKGVSCLTLRKIIEKSCSIDSPSASQAVSIREMLSNEIRRMGKVFPGGRLRGMILCGPLAPKVLPSWFFEELELLKLRGLKTDGDLREAQAGGLWVAAGCEDPVAEGAEIYGRRTIRKIPSYLDTMPQISILAQELGRFNWVPLLRAQEVLGGDEHNDRIKKRFQLGAGKRNLHVYLYKGSVEEAPRSAVDSSDITTDLPLANVSNCQARLLREVVRKLGSRDVVLKKSFFRENTPRARYGREYAEALYAAKPSVNAKFEAAENMPRTPLRRAIFDFPSPPETDTVLDIDVRIRPASGLAKIEILPEDASFLQGDRVLLNYSNMRYASSLPKRMRGWPRIEEIATDPEDRVLVNREYWVDSFAKTSPLARDYIQTLDSLRSNVITGKVRTDFADISLYLGSVDTDGRACTADGDRIIGRISRKLGSDYLTLKMRGDRRNQSLLSKIISRSGWLYLSAPPELIDEMRRILREHHYSSEWRAAVEAGSRAFAKIDDFRLLFHSIANLASDDQFEHKTFPIYAARAICNVLMFRQDGERGLDNKMAQLFARRALQRLLNQQEKMNFKSLYFQLIRLLLYLLRYRRSDPLCFDPDEPSSISSFEKAKKSMEFAKITFPKHSKKRVQIQQIIDGFDKYLHYEGTEDIISVLSGLADEEDEDTDGK